VIGILSGKGGVGKSTLALNLAAALTEQGERVILIDGDINTPAQGLLLGQTAIEHSLQDVLKGKKNIRNVTYKHPFGYHVIFAHVNDRVSYEGLRGHLDDLFGMARFVIVDGPSGIPDDVNHFLSACDQVLVVTQPDQVSVVQALKMIQLAQDQGTPLCGVVVNAVGSHNPLRVDEVSSLLGKAVIHVVRHDNLVYEAAKEQQHLIMQYRHGMAAQDIIALAQHLRQF